VFALQLFKGGWRESVTESCHVHGFWAHVVTVTHIHITYAYNWNDSITTTDKYLSSGCGNFRSHSTCRRSRPIATGKLVEINNDCETVYMKYIETIGKCAAYLICIFRILLICLQYFKFWKPSCPFYKDTWHSYLFHIYTECLLLLRYTYRVAEKSPYTQTIRTSHSI
jgi:hypothetical protein